MAKIKLPQYAWDEPREEEFELPDSWNVKVHGFAGRDRPALDARDIRAAIVSPIGMPPLREMAADRHEAVILFDDMTRSTRAAKIIPYILEELEVAGFTDDRIRFIAAVANHGALDRHALARKLGDEVVSRFAVYNHCPFLNCQEIGTTSYGTKVEINAEVMSCDLKIAVGSILPHVQYGFSGGGKLIIPGISSYDTVTAHHSVSHEAFKAERRKAGIPFLGNVDDNPMNDDAREVADMVGMDMLVNSTVNGWGEPVEVFAGAFGPTYEKALKAARTHYKSSNTGDNDIVIANTYVKASEYNMAYSTAGAIRRDGGDLVVITNSPSGQVVHYLFDKFGKTIAGRVHHTVALAPHIRNLVIYTKFPEGRITAAFADCGNVLMTPDWDQVIARLEKSNGAGAKVAVYPNADTQYFAD